MSILRIIARLSALVVPAAIVACAYFAARATSDYLEASYLDEPTAAGVRPPPAKRSEADAAPRSKDGTRLAERNMFCAECETSTFVPEIQVSAVGDEVPETRLPLRLIATSVSTVSTSSFATVVNSATAHRGAYRAGHSLPGAGPIEKIGNRYVDFRNPAAGDRLERVRLESATPPAERSRKPATSSARGGAAGSLAATIEAGVRKVGADTWEVDRAVLTAVIGNPRALRGVRILPNVADGKAAGFKVSRLSSRSPVAGIGLERGDVISAVNGFELTTPDKVLEVVAQVRTMSRVVVTVARGGGDVQLTYLLR